ncbi:MAG TPA: hypothetical protein VJR47_23255 [Stellaceae bacterium]|nr:hypothetical protein [Stellaceae bacterium]
MRLELMQDGTLVDRGKAFAGWSDIADGRDTRQMEQGFIFDENSVQRRIQPVGEACGDFDARLILADRIAGNNDLGDAALRHRDAPCVADIRGAAAPRDAPFATRTR